MKCSNIYVFVIFWRCSLDQTALLSAALNTSQQDSMVRRASIDNGGIMIRSSLDTTGFVDNFSSTNAEVISETGHDLLSACTLETKASEFSTLDHPHHQVSCTFANAVTTSKSSQVSDQTPPIAFSQVCIYFFREINLLFLYVVIISTFFSSLLRRWSNQWSLQLQLQ